MAPRSPYTPQAAFGFERSALPLANMTFTPATRVELNREKGINNDYFLQGLLVLLQFRLTIAGGTVSGVPSAAFGENLIERWEISGQHKVFGQMIRMQLQGNQVYQMARIYNGFDYLRSFSALPSGNAGTYDCQVLYHISFAPPDIRPEEQIMYLFDAPFWNSVQLYADCGNANSLIIGGDRTLTLTAFGANTGVPSIDVWRVPVKLKNSRFNVNPLPIRQYYQTFPLENNISDGTIVQLKVGNFNRSLLLHTFVRATGASAARVGDNVLASSDSIVTRYSLKRDQIAQRDVGWIVGAQLDASEKRLPFPLKTGWNVIEFVHHGTVGTAYDTRQIQLANIDFELTGDVVGAVDQRISVIYNELLGVPAY